jgi:hypothetical protein
MSAQTVRPALSPSTGRPSNSMYEDLWLRREVVVDDVVDVWHVYTTRGNISDNEDTRKPRTKFLNLFLSCSLVEVSVDYSN